MNHLVGSSSFSDASSSGKVSWVYDIDDNFDAHQLYRFCGFKGESIAGWKKIARMVILNSAMVETVSQAKKRIALFDTRIEPQGLRIIGKSGTGKSTAIRLLLSELQDPTVVDFQNDKIAHHVRLMKRSTRLSIVREGLQKFGHPLGVRNINSQTFDVKLELFIRALEQAQTRVLLIDEAQNVYACSRGKNQKSNSENEITDLICYISDRLRIPVVLVGHPELAKLEEFDVGLASRVRTTVLMPTLNADLWQESLEAYLHALSEFGDPSPLVEPKCFQRIKAHVDGQQRQLKRLISEIALHSIEHGIKRMDHQVLDTAINALKKHEIDNESGQLL